MINTVFVNTWFSALSFYHSRLTYPEKHGLFPENNPVISTSRKTAQPSGNAAKNTASSCHCFKTYLDISKHHVGPMYSKPMEVYNHPSVLSK